MASSHTDNPEGWIITGDDSKIEAVDKADNDNRLRSPAKQKKRSSKNDNRKERKLTRKEKDSTAEKLSKSKKRKRGGKPSGDKGEDPIEETGGSTLREGRFSPVGSTQGKKAQVSTKPPHDHKYKREYVEASVVLSQEGDHHMEFTMKLRGLVKE